MDSVLADLRALETDQQVAAAIVTTLPSLRLELPRLTLENMHHGIDLTREREDSVRGLSSGAGLVENGYLWLSGLGSSASQSNANGAFGYDADTYGFMIGGDKAVGERARIGLAFGFSKSDVDGDTLAYQNADVKSYQPLLYGSYVLDNQVNLSMHLGYGWHDNEITRYVPLAGTSFKGDYDASSINAGIAASRSYKMDEKTIITPSVRLDYGYIDNDSYTENSLNALSLAVSDSNVDELILGIDAKVAHKLNQDWNLTGKIGLGYDMLADEDSLNSSYAGAPGVGFSTHGTDPSSWLYRGGVGVVYGKPDTLQVSLRYDLEGREDFTNQSLSLKLNKMF
jgi:outer membrane autotransporter protein